MKYSLDPKCLRKNSCSALIFSTDVGFGEMDCRSVQMPGVKWRFVIGWKVRVPFFLATSIFDNTKI